MSRNGVASTAPLADDPDPPGLLDDEEPPGAVAGVGQVDRLAQPRHERSERRLRPVDRGDGRPRDERSAADARRPGGAARGRGALLLSLPGSAAPCLRLRRRRRVLSERAARQNPAVELAQGGVRAAVVRQDSQLHPLHVAAGPRTKRCRSGCCSSVKRPIDAYGPSADPVDTSTSTSFVQVSGGSFGCCWKVSFSIPAALAGLDDDLLREDGVDGAVAAVPLADVLVDQPPALVFGLLARSPRAPSPPSTVEVMFVPSWVSNVPAGGVAEARELLGRDRRLGQVLTT